MSEFTKNVWAVFFIAICCGVWTPLVILASVAIYCLFYWKWPWLVKRD